MNFYIFLRIYVTIIVVFILLLLFIMRKRIENFMFPDRFVRIYMLEMDNNIKRILHRKDDTTKFSYKEGEYNLYEPRH